MGVRLAYVKIGSKLSLCSHELRPVLVPVQDAVIKVDVGIAEIRVSVGRFGENLSDRIDYGRTAMVYRYTSDKVCLS